MTAHFTSGGLSLPAPNTMHRQIRANGIAAMQSRGSRSNISNEHHASSTRSYTSDTKIHPHQFEWRSDSYAACDGSSADDPLNTSIHNKATRPISVSGSSGSFALSGALEQASMLPYVTSLSKSSMSSMRFAFDANWPDWYIEPNGEWWLKPHAFTAEAADLPMYVAYPCYPTAMCEESSGREYDVMKRFADFMQNKWPEYGRGEGEWLPCDTRAQILWA